MPYDSEMRVQTRRDALAHFRSAWGIISQSLCDNSDSLKAHCRGVPMRVVAGARVRRGPFAVLKGFTVWPGEIMRKMSSVFGRNAIACGAAHRLWLRRHGKKLIENIHHENVDGLIMT